MEKLEELLKKELNRYEHIRDKANQRLLNKPNGKLRISFSNKKVQYYHCYKECGKPCGEYIPKAEFELAKQLAQKTYDEKVVRLAEKRIKQLIPLVNEYQASEIEKIFLGESKQRQELIEPVEKTWNQKLEEWMAEEYEGKGFAEEDPLILTDRGERVRSKSEKILADYFYHNNIPYKYEKPLYLKGYGVVYPDFTFLHRNTLMEKYWEHEGMMDDPRYATAAINKRKTYEENGIFLGDRLIITSETKSTVLNVRDIERNVRRLIL